ncbi:hypothetical protein IFM46972_08366 [Aspergillus udagawae]|uniref:Uncharacterized protein n=1 Tax=Aspergillus udagawae TaxID=91492 RepID=A0A8H3P9J9_9EURO|nr:hypothetical protein IFM46972_08366 [Aspergillus udagawae]
MSSVDGKRRDTDNETMAIPNDNEHNQPISATEVVAEVRATQPEAEPIGTHKLDHPDPRRRRVGCGHAAAGQYHDYQHQTQHIRRSSRFARLYKISGCNLISEDWPVQNALYAQGLVDLFLPDKTPVNKLLSLLSRIKDTEQLETVLDGTQHSAPDIDCQRPLWSGTQTFKNSTMPGYRVLVAFKSEGYEPLF